MNKWNQWFGKVSYKYSRSRLKINNFASDEYLLDICVLVTKIFKN